MPINEGEFKIYDPYDAYLNEIDNDALKFNELNNRIRKFPRNLFDFIFDIATGDFIKDRISLPLGLNENQSQETAKIIMELIITDLYLGNIVNEVRDRLGVDEQKAKTIAGLIVIQLFAPILEDLKKMHLEKFAGATKKEEVKNELSPPLLIQPSELPVEPPKPKAEDESIIDLRNLL